MINVEALKKREVLEIIMQMTPCYDEPIRMFYDDEDGELEGADELEE